MDKSAIRKFAVDARVKLIEQVKQKASEIGITADRIIELPRKNKHLQNEVFKKKREQLISAVKSKGFEQVMEEVAYTWFSSFIALRFMEVNGYLPTGVRLLSSADSARVEPDIFEAVVNVDLDLDLEKVSKLQDKGHKEGLFKCLILAQCNGLHQIMPFMFKRTNGYSELLFPDNLLAEDSVIQDMISSIDEEDWREVEIVGWLFQFYMQRKKNEVFAALKRRKKITKENIPAATQLFTPKWIVQYMVENSLGRLWLESHPESDVGVKWNYYLPPVEQDTLVQQQLDSLKKPCLHPEDITVMDPACGSGHILVYAFDVLYQIYEERGYLRDDIPALILRNNLFGLEIDDRAAQLASFVLVMKARSKSPTIFQKEVVPNILSIQESNNLEQSTAYNLMDESVKEIVDELIDFYKDAKNYGSILKPHILNLDQLQAELPSLTEYDDEGASLSRFEALIRQTELLSRKYDVVITNPPYMYARNMNAELSAYLRKHYRDSKADLFAAFLERSITMTKDGGAVGTINQHSWMFLSSYERLRVRLLETKIIQSLLHLGAGAFEEIGGEVVQSTAFVLRNTQCPEFKGEYYRLIDGDNSDEKRELFLNGGQKYIKRNTNFRTIPGCPIAYWASDTVRGIFEQTVPLGELSQPRQGLATGNNKRFLRLWHEVDINRIGFDMRDDHEASLSGKKWFPYNKGGAFRKWYGNQEYVINWENDGADIKEFDRAVIRNPSYYFRSGITWSFVGSARFGARYTPPGFIFDVGGSSLFPKKEHIPYILGFLCSKLGHEFLSYLNPTLNFQVGNIRSLPIRISDEKFNLISSLVKKNINISRIDWDSYEDSWSFRKHPLLEHKSGGLVEDAFRQWEVYTEDQFQELKANEQELNRIFIGIYELEDELAPDVIDEDITIRKAHRKRDVKSFISYAVGCMFGRYSLDEDGLVFAGGDFDPNRYKTFDVVKDNVIPIGHGEYFEDDIVFRFVDFVAVTFGIESLEDNLEYIADSIGRRSSETARESIRRYFFRSFYKDHVQIYRNRPIYWMFRSEQGTFAALIYMHRYDEDTVSRVRSYLLYLQDKLTVEEGRLRQLLTTDVSEKERTELEKQLKVLSKQVVEVREYDEKIKLLADMGLSIDLDDGVVVNYRQFAGILAEF